VTRRKNPAATPSARAVDPGRALCDVTRRPRTPVSGADPGSRAGPTVRRRRPSPPGRRTSRTGRLHPALSRAKLTMRAPSAPGTSQPASHPFGSSISVPALPRDRSLSIRAPTRTPDGAPVQPGPAQVRSDRPAPRGRHGARSHLRQPTPRHPRQRRRSHVTGSQPTSRPLAVPPTRATPRTPS
jgi:hypothetical protein